MNIPVARVVKQFEQLEEQISPLRVEIEFATTYLSKRATAKELAVRHERASPSLERLLGADTPCAEPDKSSSAEPDKSPEPGGSVPGQEP